MEGSGDVGIIKDQLSQIVPCTQPQLYSPFPPLPSFLMARAGMQPLPSTATWGMVLHVVSVVVQIVALATNQWVTARSGSALVTSGLWSVCTIAIPFIRDGCDGIERPAAAIFAARTFAVLGGILGPLSVLFSVAVYFLLPTRTFFFFSIFSPLLPGASGFIATIAFGAAAAQKAAEGKVVYDLGFAAFLFAWIFLGLTSGLYFLAYLKKRSEVQASSNARRNISGWASSGLKHSKKKKRKKKKKGG